MWVKVLEDNKCKAIVHDGTNYYLYQTNKEKINISSVFLKNMNDMLLTGLQFGYDDQENNVIYGLYQNNQRTVIYQFDDE